MKLQTEAFVSESHTTKNFVFEMSQLPSEFYRTCLVDIFHDADNDRKFIRTIKGEWLRKDR